MRSERHRQSRGRSGVRCRPGGVPMRSQNIQPGQWTYPVNPLGISHFFVVGKLQVRPVLNRLTQELLVVILAQVVPHDVAAAIAEPQMAVIVLPQAIFADQAHKQGGKTHQTPPPSSFMGPLISPLKISSALWMVSKDSGRRSIIQARPSSLMGERTPPAPSRRHEFSGHRGFRLPSGPNCRRRIPARGQVRIRRNQPKHIAFGGVTIPPQ